MIKRIKGKIGVLLSLALVLEGMSGTVLAGDAALEGVSAPAYGAGGLQDYEIVPDMAGTGLKVFDENGNELDTSGEECTEAVDTYNAILSQFSGKTIDMSGYDATDALLEAFGDREETAVEEETDGAAQADTAADTRKGSGTDVADDTLSVGGDSGANPAEEGDDSGADFGEADYDSGVYRTEAEDDGEEITLKAPVVNGDDVTWDCVWFGSYRGKGTSDSYGAIKWRVLETDGESALLMADRPLTDKTFDSSFNTQVTYEKSYLKSWAEKFFYNDAFTTMEQQSIALQEGGKKISIPSRTVVENRDYGFINDKARAAGTDGYWIDGGSEKPEYISGAGARAEFNPSGSRWSGRFARRGVETRGFRPVIRLELEEDDEWSYAGTVSLKSGAKEKDPAFVSQLELDAGDDATVEEKESLTVKLVKGKPLKAFPDAVKKQKDFTGWYDKEEGGTRYTGDSVIPEDVDTLYAHFESKYENTYHFNEKVSLKIAKSPKRGEIPFLSNGFDIDFAGISTSFEYDRVEGTYQVGIGFDLARTKDIKKEGSFKNFLKAEGKDLEDTVEKVWNALDSARDAGGPPIRVDDGSWEPSLRVMGFAEGTLDDDGISAPESGRLFIGFEIYKDMNWQTAIAFIPIALRLKFGAEGSVTFGIEQDEKTEATILVGDVELVIPGIELRAGVGLARVASIGVYGAAQNKIELEFGRDRTGKTAGYWYLSGEAGGYVQLLFFDYKKKFVEGRIDILEWGNHSASMKGAGGSGDIDGEYEVKRTHEDPVKDWMKSKHPEEDVLGFAYNPENGALGDGRTPLLSDMYDMPEPFVVQTKDTALLVFMAENDEQEVLTGDHVSVYYSIWNNVEGKWEKPAHIDSDYSTAEFYPVLATDGTDIWAVWMDSKSKITEADSQVLESVSGENLTGQQKDVLKKRMSDMEIKAARFDGSGFTDIVTLADDNVMSARPAAVAYDGKLYVSWLEDEAVDLDIEDNEAADTGVESIITAVYDGEKWLDEVVTEKGNMSYTDLNVGLVGGKPVAAYGKDEDRKLSGTEDARLYARVLPSGNEIKLSEHEAHTPDFGVIAGAQCLIWYEDGTLRYTEDTEAGNGGKTIEFSDTSVLSPDFMVLDDYAYEPEDGEGGTVVLCNALDPQYDPENPEQSDAPHRGIYAYVLDEQEDGSVDAGWPIYIRNTGNYGDAGTVAGLWKTDAEGYVSDLVLVYPETRTDFKSDDTATFAMDTTMFMTSFVDDGEVTVNEDDFETFIEPEDIERGESVSLNLAIKNSRFDVIKDVYVAVVHGDKEIKREKITLKEPLEAGDETQIKVGVSIPEEIKKGDSLRVRIDTDEDADEGEDREMSFRVGEVDLFLDQTVSANESGLSVMYSVENTSIFDTTGTFRLYTKDDNDEEKTLYEEKDISFPAKTTVSTVFEEEMLEELADLGDVIYAEVVDADGDRFETLAGDNADFFRIGRARAEEVVISQKELTLSKGDSAVVSAYVVPQRPSQVGVYWCSTDDDVAEVDSAGKVTAKGPGVAQIIATANDGSGVRASAKVTVSASPEDMAAEGDTAVLTARSDSKGRVKGYQLSLSQNVTSAVVTVAKGNRFVITGGGKGSFGLKSPADKKLVSVNKKGLVKAKKATEGVVISYTDQSTGKNVEVTVRVREMRFEGSKNLQTTVSVNAPFALQPQLLNNAEFRPKNDRFRAVVPDLKYEKDNGARWIITGVPAKSGTVSIPVYVYDKKFTMKIKVK